MVDIRMQCHAREQNRVWPDMHIAHNTLTPTVMKNSWHNSSLCHMTEPTMLYTNKAYSVTMDNICEELFNIVDGVD